MKFIGHLAFSVPEHYVAMAKAMDESGFDSCAVSDHVVHPQTIDTPYPYTPDGQPRWEPFTPWPDPWVAIGAMASVTERLRFVTSIYVLAMRNPFAVAKVVATAAAFSNNRVAMGIGTGWMEEEFRLLEQPFRRRGKRMDEMLTVLRTLWQGGMVEHHGEFYDFAPLEMTPVPTATVPIYTGGFSKAALRRAGRLCDGWISDLHSTEEIGALISTVLEYRQDSDRAGQPLDVLASANDAFDVDGYRRLEDVGVTHILTMPWLFYGADPALLDEKTDGIRRFADDVIAKM